MGQKRWQIQSVNINGKKPDGHKALMQQGRAELMVDAQKIVFGNSSLDSLELKTGEKSKNQYQA